MDAQEEFDRIGMTLFKIALAGITLLIVVVVAMSPDLYETPLQFICSYLPGQRVEVRRNVAYAAPEDSVHVGDMYFVPSARTPRPAIVLAHGGSWSLGDRNDTDEIVTALAMAKRGYTAFVIDFRMSDHDGQFPNDARDINTAVSYLVAHKSELNIDPNQIYVSGTSSGGTAALLAAYLPDAILKEEKRAKINGVISFAAPTNLSTVFGANEFVRSKVEAYVAGADAETFGARCQMSSPVDYSRTAIPTVIVHGTEDRNVSIHQAEELERALEKAHVPVLLIRVEKSAHFIGARSRAEALNRAITFFKSQPPN